MNVCEVYSVNKIVNKNVLLLIKVCVKKYFSRKWVG